MAAITETKLTVELLREKETKRTVRYEEPGDEPRIGTLYMPKATLERMGAVPWPDRLTVTVETGA